MIENHSNGFIRAWHGHKKEGKFVLVVKGSALVGAVKIDNWENPSKNLEVKRFVLSENNPAILYIPKGYANGFKSLSNDLKIVFYSTSSLEEAMEDDYRYGAYHWNPWKVEER